LHKNSIAQIEGKSKRIKLIATDKAVARLIQGIPQKGLISGLFADGRPMRSYFFALPPGRRMRWMHNSTNWGCSLNYRVFVKM